MDTAKYKIPKQCRIGDTCFMSLANIGGNLFTRHPKNINHVHKDINDILSVIIILGTDVHGGKYFFNGITMNEIGEYHILLRIHMEVLWLVPLIKIYIKALFGLNPELLYISLHK